MPDQAPEPCQHPTAYVVASIGDPGNDDPDARGLPWQQIPDHHMVGDTDLSGDVGELLRHHFRPEGLDGIKAHISLGICSGCYRLVVTVRMGDHKRWTVEHGPAWSSPWTPLVGDGEPRAGSIPAPDRHRTSRAGDPLLHSHVTTAVDGEGRSRA
jgi:hypothetical protein